MKLFDGSTKWSPYDDALREKDSRKVECGEARSKALDVTESPARYLLAKRVDDVLKDALRGSVQLTA